MIYNSLETIYPFWSENSGFMTGRDPLGVQNSSISVYGRLLPGLTNLTQRLRYYGIYCWLLKEYDNLGISQELKTLEHQYNFIRRAELIIAFLMINEHSNEKSVIGSDYANNNKGEVVDNGFYDIKLGANKHQGKGGLYWDFRSGALGQYYAGSLINLELIEIKSKFFHIRDRGLELASAFENSVTKEVRIYFLKLIDNGKVNLTDIKVILPFSLNDISEQSAEWYFYKEMLLEGDGVNFMSSPDDKPSKRRDSISLYLEYRNVIPENLTFTEWIYANINKDVYENSAFFGWYYYYINEAYHFALETLFWGMLVSLDGRILPINAFIKEITEFIIQENCENKEIKPKEIFENVIKSSYNERLILKLTELEELSRYEENSQSALGKSVELLAIIYHEIAPYIDKIKKFEAYNFISQQKGNVTEHTQTYIVKNFGLMYVDYIEKIIKILLNDHISTAYRKMGNGESNLLKFLIEDNLIAHIQTMWPKHTTPRIHTLHNFLNDLNLLDSNALLTSHGSDLLKELTA